MKSLKNTTILITKPKESAEKYFFKLSNEGAKIIYFPTIKIVPKNESPELKFVINQFSVYDYMIFSSSNAVKVFKEIIKNRSIDLSKIKIAAIGEKTSEECYTNGFKVDIIPEEYSSKGLTIKFSKHNLIGKKIFIPCSSLTNEDLKLGLMELGAEVDLVHVYDVYPNDLSELANEYDEITKTLPDLFVFTSPSSFNSFVSLMRIDDVLIYFYKKIICAIGSTTEKAINNYGLNAQIVPNTFALSGIADSIIEYFN